MKWKTNITEMIGCEYPIILGAFAGFDNTQLTASISKAGGFGVLTGSYFSKEEKLRTAIKEIKNITNNPFGINLSPNNPPDFRKDLYELFGTQFEIAREEKIKTIITVGPKVEIIGKKIIDASGNEIGEVEDIELDWDTKTIKALILGGKGEMAEKLFSRLGARSAPDIPVPVEAVAVMGTVIVLSKKISDL